MTDGLASEVRLSPRPRSVGSGASQCCVQGGQRALGKLEWLATAVGQATPTRESQK